MVLSKIQKIPVDIQNVFRYIKYMAELTKWQETGTKKPKFKETK
jgi:hypothetical protein